MPDMQWGDAIHQVLLGEGTSLHYTDIAQRIVEKGLRKSVGATPASTVNGYISYSIKQDGKKSPFVRTGRGYYMLRELSAASEVAIQSESDAEAPGAGIINAFGMYWNRGFVNWGSKYRLLGMEQKGAETVDFFEQRGVYLLHDQVRTIYVGACNRPSTGRSTL